MLINIIIYFLVQQKVAPTGGLEPPTARLEVGYSIQLNYVGAGWLLLNNVDRYVNLVICWRASRLLFFSVMELCVLASRSGLLVLYPVELEGRCALLAAFMRGVQAPNA